MAAACTPLHRADDPEPEPLAPVVADAAPPPRAPPPQAIPPIAPPLAATPSSQTADAGDTAQPPPADAAPPADAPTEPTPADGGADGTCGDEEPSVHDVQVHEATAARSTRFGEWFGGDCAPGYRGDGCSVEASRLGRTSPLAAGCYVTQESRRSCRCRIRWWADALTTLRCEITIYTRPACDR